MTHCRSGPHMAGGIRLRSRSRGCPPPFKEIFRNSDKDCVSLGPRFKLPDSKSAPGRIAAYSCLFLAPLSFNSARVHAIASAPCNTSFRELGEESEALTALEKAGLAIKGHTEWGTPIVDGTSFPQGGSGAVRLHVMRAPHSDSEKYQVAFLTAMDADDNAMGTIVYVKEIESGRVIFVAVPPGHETVNAEVASKAWQLRGTVAK